MLATLPPRDTSLFQHLRLISQAEEEWRAEGIDAEKSSAWHASLGVA